MQNLISSEALWSADLSANIIVPVLRPRLPCAEQLLPYLQRIDATRWYSNRGPLVREFEARLSTHTGAAGVVSVGNATLGLGLALMAQGAKPGTLCMIPAWTFAASGHAALLAGLIPWLVDVDPDTWELSTAQANKLLSAAPAPVGAIMPVMPFGSPIDSGAWERFHEATGIPVVIDAAAGFDSLKASSVPAVVSLHATKVIGVGEGGFVASNDEALIDRIRSLTNFGFVRSREAMTTALNAKLSEYAAAVGLAALDGWPASRQAYARVGSSYGRASVAVDNQMRLQSGFGHRWISSTVVVRLPSDRVGRVVSELTKSGIGIRRWWGAGLHSHGAFCTYPRTELPVTEGLAVDTVGLPCWPDLPESTIQMMCEIIARTLELGSEPKTVQ